MPCEHALCRHSHGTRKAHCVLTRVRGGPAGAGAGEPRAAAAGGHPAGGGPQDQRLAARGLRARQHQARPRSPAPPAAACPPGHQLPQACDPSHRVSCCCSRASHGVRGPPRLPAAPLHAATPQAAPLARAARTAHRAERRGAQHVQARGSLCLIAGATRVAPGRAAPALLSETAPAHTGAGRRPSPCWQAARQCVAALRAAARSYSLGRVRRVAASASAERARWGGPAQRRQESERERGRARRDRNIERLMAEREQAKLDAHVRDEQARCSEERARELRERVAELEGQCAPCAPSPLSPCTCAVGGRSCLPGAGSSGAPRVRRMVRGAERGEAPGGAPWRGRGHRAGAGLHGRSIARCALHAQPEDRDSSA